MPGATSALPLHWEDPQESEDCPIFPELVPNRHKQKGPDFPFKSVEAQMYLCSKLPGSFHIAYVISHCFCFITHYCCALVSPLLLSWDLLFQDCSIWLHSDRMLGPTEKLLVERASVSEVMALPLDYLSHGYDVKRQDCSPDKILLPRHQCLWQFTLCPHRI